MVVADADMPDAFRHIIAKLPQDILVNPIKRLLHIIGTENSALYFTGVFQLQQTTVLAINVKK